MTRCGTCSARPLRVFSASSRFAAVCRFPFSSIKSQTLLGPLRISHSFSTRCRLAHISPILSERFVPTAPARGPVSNLFLLEPPRYRMWRCAPTYQLSCSKDGYQEDWEPQMADRPCTDAPLTQCGAAGRRGVCTGKLNESPGRTVQALAPEAKRLLTLCTHCCTLA